MSCYAMIGMIRLQVMLLKATALPGLLTLHAASYTSDDACQAEHVALD